MLRFVEMIIFERARENKRILKVRTHCQFIIYFRRLLPFEVFLWIWIWMIMNSFATFICIICTMYNCTCTACNADQRNDHMLSTNQSIKMLSFAIKLMRTNLLTKFEELKWVRSNVFCFFSSFFYWAFVHNAHAACAYKFEFTSSASLHRWMDVSGIPLIVSIRHRDALIFRNYAFLDCLVPFFGVDHVTTP